MRSVHTKVQSLKPGQHLDINISLRTLLCDAPVEGHWSVTGGNEHPETAALATTFIYGEGGTDSLYGGAGTRRAGYGRRGR